DYNAIIPDLLSPSLKDLFNFCSSKFILKTALLLISCSYTFSDPPYIPQLSTVTGRLSCVTNSVHA
ncbi:hypothetical protein F5887DRAFT_884576, partial [Amanita rubescens]